LRVALGRAFIEIHADTKPFRKDVREGVNDAFKSNKQNIGDAATKGMTEGLKKYRFIPGTFQGVLITGLSGVLIAAAPAIATALQGAFTAAVGLAGIGSAVALAISASPELQEAGKALGQKILLGLQQATTTLIGPIKNALQILSNAFDTVIPQIRSGFESLGPSIEILAQGIANFVVNLMPGFIQAMKDSGPAIQQLAIELGELGTFLSDVFAEMSDDAETTVQGIKILFGLLTVTLAGSFTIIDALANAWQGYINVLHGATEVLQFFSPLAQHVNFELEEMEGATGMLKDITDKAAASTGQMGNAWSSAAIAGRGLIETVRELYGIELDVTDAAIRVEEGMDRVTETFKENTNTLSLNSEEGRENVAVVNQVIRGALAEHEAQIAAGAGVDVANAAYRRRIAELRTTLRQAGLTEKQIDSLIGAYQEVPDEVGTKVTAPGLPGILSQAQALQRTLQAIHSQRIRVRMAADGTGPGGLAEGGVVTSPTLSWVGEAGPEAVVPLTDPARARQVMAEAGIGGSTIVYLVVDGEIIDKKVARSNSNEARRVSFRPRMV
jgi:hypothetical protein